MKVLAALALATAALSVSPTFASRGAGTAASGIRGRVTESPTCPVERDPPDPACAPRGFAAGARFSRTRAGHTVGRFTTGDDGRFRTRLRPGRYGFTAQPASGARLPRCDGSVKARVRAGRYTRVAII